MSPPSESTEVVLGTLATAAMLTYTLLGLPAQVRRNHVRRSTGDLSGFTYALSFLAFALFSAYGIVKGDRFVTLSNVPGTILAGIILGQILFYRRRSKAAAAGVSAEDRHDDATDDRTGSA
ncbi:MAG: SemiSWEET family transporter [Planctomycetota bacterium]